ncbi:uncharacterized protein LOC107748882 [Sinocyclocheilus rhinocerous]|uniref:uncharacterized protein LOC107748882 n=1 Tax=Sinocyclocheilus rhinocerous TaxID=307959 RepID=UPI0007B9CE4D|nr:PREDICTED: uncharacterized protein LOC107748882 [Sinocyclocheilus rhinocerous]
MANNLNVDEARNGEDNTTPVDDARRLTNGEENTTQSQLVTPSGVPSSCAPDKSAAPDNLKTVVSVPLSGSNRGSEPCDGGVAVTPRDSLQDTTTQSLEPKSNGCNTSTLRCGEKRERESDNPSDVPVKRRLRPSEDNGKECLPDYDVRCAELWIDGEMAAWEAYELSKSSSDTQRQHVVRQHDSNSSVNRPSTQKDVVRVVRAEVAACFQPITKLILLNMEWSRTDFTEMINRLRALQRDVTELANEMRNMRADQRLALDAISLMNERMSVIQRCVCETHQMMTTTRK